MLEALVLHYKNTLNGKSLLAIMWQHHSLACVGPSGLLVHVHCSCSQKRNCNRCS